MMLRKGMLARKQRTASMRLSKSKPADAAKKKPETVEIRGTKMQKRNADKTHEYVGGYRLGGDYVSKKAMKTQGPKAVTDALKGSMKEKRMRHGASQYDRGYGPKRIQTEAYIQSVNSGRAGQSLWSAHKNAAKGGY